MVRRIWDSALAFCGGGVVSAALAAGEPSGVAVGFVFVAISALRWE